LTFSWGLTIILCLSILLSSVFSYIYFLLNNFSRVKLLQITGEQSRQRVERILDNLPRILNTVVAVEIMAKTALVLSLWVLISNLFGPDEPAFFRPAPLVWTFAVSSLWIVLFCRILPAELGARNEEIVLNRILPFLNSLSIILFPFHALLAPFRRTVVKTLKPSNPEEEAEHIAEEIIDAVDEGEREGYIGEDEADMIENIMELRDAEVSDIMTPRTDMKAVEVETPLKEAIRLAMDLGHSRIPVYREDIDHVIGVLYVKDIMIQWLEDKAEKISLEEIVRSPYFIPETKKISELLLEFREHQIHIAIVLDEYGGTAGLVTNEDILEEIVGEIVDEYDKEETVEIRAIDERTFDVPARLHIDDLNEELGTDISEGKDFETIGGYVFSALGKVPKKGESVTTGNVKLTVTDVGDRRIKRLTVRIDRDRPDGGE